MERLISVAEINKDFRERGLVLLVDLKGDVSCWGLPSRRIGLTAALAGRCPEMARYLTMQALRGYEGEL